ncbi:alpha 1,2 mannosyltransferase [Exophiala xenobiotica]|uniref:Mannosyltransferase n=1 Tax=Lithohypha guttulata TaxID=1690604 RepID=A0ABR0K4V8_9EURO|nr:alpha 1,2 mannosyltransferase [Lithohypha guttulata]KAK5330687.1 alpha 1,2 mannosyltransferase [Exophiala xenobiotica]
MWRRTYLLLLLVRVYFAVSPSYLHPDEIFQGPEVIAGEVFGYRNVRTWEWTVAKPIRSVFPLWPVYGLPMALLKALWSREGDGVVSATTIYYTLRMAMFALCFVLEDWAIHELVPSRRKRKNAVTLVASSYVTWTFQTHTFSNSVETLLVLWCLVLMQRIAGPNSLPSSPVDEKPVLENRAVPRSLFVTSGLALGFLMVWGVFNRITFPAFLLIPGMQLLPHLLNRPLALAAILVSATFWLFVAIATDTAFYNGPAATTSFRALFSYIHTIPVITPINNLLYNTKASNLKQHGLHPHYQHLLVNLPQLLGPALLLLVPLPPRGSSFNIDRMLHNPRLTAAITGTVILSVIPHQEPRFLLPCIPLLLTCVRLPADKAWRKRFWVAWGIFNALLGILMGIYHQGGIIPAQLNMPNTIRTSLLNTNSNTKRVEVHWWKTYPPSLYMLGQPIHNPLTDAIVEIHTNPLLGANRSTLLSTLNANLPFCTDHNSLLAKFTNALPTNSPPQVLLAAPFSAFRPEYFSGSIPPISNFTFTLRTDADHGAQNAEGLRLTHLETYRRHINLDDMDFGDDGVLPTLSRVVGRRGLGVWRVERECAVDGEGR